MSKTLGNFIDLEKLRGVIETTVAGCAALLPAAGGAVRQRPGLDRCGFRQGVQRAGQRAGQLAEPHAEDDQQLPRRRGAGGADELEEIDRDLLAQIRALPGELAAGVSSGCELQTVRAAAARAGAGDQRLHRCDRAVQAGQGPGQAGRLDTVLNLCAQAISRALLALLPILPHKAADGLSQLDIDPAGQTLEELLKTPIPPARKSGQGQPLFPRVETGKGK